MIKLGLPTILLKVQRASAQELTVLLITSPFKGTVARVHLCP